MSSTASIPIIRPDDYSSVAHPGDLLSRRQRLVYVLVLGALTALGPFTVDLYLPAFPVLQDELGVSAAAVQLTLTGTMVGFGSASSIVGR
jgi:DHA1 family bicyclomycin/chloramphenicol resistance-like MFS transporter